MSETEQQIVSRSINELLMMQTDEKIKAFIGNGGQKLLSDLETIPDARRKIEIAQNILDIARSPLFKPDDLPLLVESLSYEARPDTASAAAYGTKEGYASWDDYRIWIHNRLIELPDDADRSAATSHYLGHELSHSIIELADEESKLKNEEIDEEETEEGVELHDLLRNIQSSLESVPTETESPYIQWVKQKNPSRFSKERLADAMGGFIASGQNEEQFIRRRLKAIPPRIIGSYINADQKITLENYRGGLTEDGEDLLDDIHNLYHEISKSWNQIMDKVREIKPKLDMLKEAEEEEPVQTPANKKMATQEQDGQSIEQTNGYDRITNNKQTPGKESQPLPGEQPKQNDDTLEAIGQCAKGFVQAFADEVGGGISQAVSQGPDLTG